MFKTTENSEAYQTIGEAIEAAKYQARSLMRMVWVCDLDGFVYGKAWPFCGSSTFRLENR